MVPDSEQPTIGVAGHTGWAAFVRGGQNDKPDGPTPGNDPEQAKTAQAALLKLLSSVRR